MARRRVGTLGWLVLLVIIGGAYTLFAPHSAPQVQDNGTAAIPFFSRPPEQQPAATQKAKIFYVTATTLNVRSTPSTGGTVLFSAPRGTPVVAVSQTEGWYEVKLTSGSTGWMNSAYLSATPPVQQQAPVASRKPPPDQGPVPKPAPPQKQIDRGAIVRAIIADSVASYPGNCPCPYNTDRAGRSCGRRSAWSKAGGYAPLCYPDDVTAAMISDYAARR